MTSISSQSAYVFKSSCKTGDWKWDVNDVLHSVHTDDFARCEESTAGWNIQSCKSRPGCIEKRAKLHNISLFDWSLKKIMISQINPISLALVRIKYLSFTWEVGILGKLLALLDPSQESSGAVSKQQLFYLTNLLCSYAVAQIYFSVWEGRERSWPHILVSLMAWVSAPQLITHCWKENTYISFLISLNYFP